MNDEFSLFNLNGISDIAIKMLDMIEKSVGWVVVPRGKRCDFNEAVEIYKKQLIDSDNIDSIAKSVLIANARSDLKKYMNQGKIIENSLQYLSDGARPDDVDEDWLLYFFEYAKNISNEEIQQIWGKLLAEKVNGTHNITKKLINVFSVLDQADIEIFCVLCSMSFDDSSKPGGQYPFIYIRSHPAYYNSFGIRRNNLAQLDNMGLIEYDTHGNYVLPSRIPVLQYGKYFIELESAGRIDNGNVRFTEIGQVLYRLTNIAKLEDFVYNCKKVWDDKGVKYTIKESASENRTT